MRREIIEAMARAGLSGEAAKLANCSTYWRAELLHSVEMVDVISVNRCKSRFCPNCARIRAARYAQAIRAYAEAHPAAPLYAITLTLPSAEALAPRLRDLMGMWQRLYKAATAARKPAPLRMIGAIRSVEITWSIAGGWHPHLHILAEIPQPIPENQIPATAAAIGEWMRAADPCPPRTYQEPYQADVQPISSGTAAEVAKYACKLQEIAALPPERLRELVEALHHLRAYQGAGTLLHVASSQKDKPLDQGTIERLVQGYCGKREGYAGDGQPLQQLYTKYDKISTPPALRLKIERRARKQSAIDLLAQIAEDVAAIRSAQAPRAGRA